MSPFWILLALRMIEAAVTTAAMKRAKFQSNRHHQQTYAQLLEGRMPFLSPNQQCQSTEGTLGQMVSAYVIICWPPRLCPLKSNDIVDPEKSDLISRRQVGHLVWAYDFEGLTRSTTLHVEAMEAITFL